MILTPEMDIGTIRKYYPNLSTEQQADINKKANTIIECINHPQLLQVNQYKGIYSTDEKNSKVLLPLNIHGQLGSNNGLSEGVMLSGPYEGKRHETEGRGQGIITLAYELDKNLGENDRIRSLFLHNMETTEELSIEEQFTVLEKNQISSIDELAQFIRNSVNYRAMHSCTIRHLFVETKIFKKIP